MIDLDKSVKDAMALNMAKSILDNLPDDKKNAIFLEAIAKSLESYSFRNEVEKIVADEGTAVIKKLLQEDPTYRERVVAAVKSGFDKYVDKLSVATEALFIEMMHGKDEGSGYTRCANLLHKLKELK